MWLLVLVHWQPAGLRWSRLVVVDLLLSVCLFSCSSLLLFWHFDCWQTLRPWLLPLADILSLLLAFVFPPYPGLLTCQWAFPFFPTFSLARNAYSQLSEAVMTCSPTSQGVRVRSYCYATVQCCEPLPTSLLSLLQTMCSGHKFYFSSAQGEYFFHQHDFVFIYFPLLLAYRRVPVFILVYFNSFSTFSLRDFSTLVMTLVQIPRFWTCV